MKTVAGLIIGNEILSGKIADTNAQFLIASLYRLGAQLKRLVIVPDILQDIATELARLAQGYDYVVTSGGIGPTHDDVTLESVAQAIGKPLLAHSEMEAIYRQFNPDPDPQVLVKMTHLPEGSVLISDAVVPWPVIRVGNIFVLPGVPPLFEKKLESLFPLFQSDPFHTARLHVDGRESLLAPLLIATCDVTGVEIGSYPRQDDNGRYVLLILESKDPVVVQHGLNDLCARLASGGLAFTVVEATP